MNVFGCRSRANSNPSFRRLSLLPPLASAFMFGGDIWYPGTAETRRKYRSSPSMVSLPVRATQIIQDNSHSRYETRRVDPHDPQNVLVLVKSYSCQDLRRRRNKQSKETFYSINSEDRLYHRSFIDDSSSYYSATAEEKRLSSIYEISTNQFNKKLFTSSHLDDHDIRIVGSISAENQLGIHLADNPKHVSGEEQRVIVGFLCVIM